MVPFSFANITRIPGLDTPVAFPVSESARATHESFKSHLQRTAAPTIDPPDRRPAPKDEPRQRSDSTSNDSPSNEPPRNEPVRKDTAETQRDDADVRRSDTTEATTAERNDEDKQQDAGPEDDAAIAAAAQAPQAVSQEDELQVSGDAEDITTELAANKGTATSLPGEESELAPSLEADADKPVGEETPASLKVKLAGNAPADSVDSATRTGNENLSDTNKEVAASELQEKIPVTETTIQDDVRSKASKTQRRDNRNDLSIDQPTLEAKDAKTIAVDIGEITADSTSEDGLPQQQNRGNADEPQPTANASAGDATKSTQGGPSRFAQHLLARTDESSGRGQNITNADQARFVDRVARAMQATGERGGTLRLRLSPPELGALALEIKVQGGVVSARVEADTQSARNLLLENLPVLRQRLAELGMQVEQFDIDLSDRRESGTPDGLQHNDQQQEDRPRAKASKQEPDEAPQAITNTMPTKNGNEQLNIIV